MLKFLLVCLAGAIGTGARYLIGLGAVRVFGPNFPVGTLIVNLVGCFLIAVVAELGLNVQLLSPTTRLVLATGFMGGLTTYSAFNLDLTAFLRDTKTFSTGLIYLGATLAGCFVCGLVGMFAARAYIAK